MATAPSGSNPHTTEIAKAQAADVYSVPCAPCVVGDRVAFSKSVVYGQAVQEYEPKDRKATDEIRSLYRYICDEMEV